MELFGWFRKSVPQQVGVCGFLVDMFGGGAARSGVAVNARTALECSPVPACVRVIAIGLSLALEAYGASSFRNGVRSPGILSTDQRPDENHRKVIRGGWEVAFSGVENAGKAPVLGFGMRWTQLSIANDAAQFIEPR